MIIKYNNYLINYKPILSLLDFGLIVNICQIECIYFSKQTLFPPGHGHKIYYKLNVYNKDNCKLFIRYSFDENYKHKYGKTYIRKKKISDKRFSIEYNGTNKNLGFIKQYFYRRKIIKYISLVEKNLYKSSIYDDKKGNVLIYKKF